MKNLSWNHYPRDLPAKAMQNIGKSLKELFISQHFMLFALDIWLSQKSIEASTYETFTLAWLHLLDLPQCDNQVR